MSTKVEVEQGDCISSIAFEKGFFPDTIWNHQANAELKQKRKDPNVLLPGDVVTIPDKRLKIVDRPTGAMHRFRLKSVPKKLRVQITFNNKPMGGAGYKIDIDGKKKEGKTDSGGWLTQPILPDAKIAKIVFENGLEYELNLGQLDPVDEAAGVQQRLYSLGFYRGEINQVMNEETVDALRVFQNTYGIEPTGVADAKTKAQLQKLTGG